MHWFYDNTKINLLHSRSSRTFLITIVRKTTIFFIKFQQNNALPTDTLKIDKQHKYRFGSIRLINVMSFIYINDWILTHCIGEKKSITKFARVNYAKKKKLKQREKKNSHKCVLFLLEKYAAVVGVRENESVGRSESLRAGKDPQVSVIVHLEYPHVFQTFVRELW